MSVKFPPALHRTSDPLPRYRLPQPISHSCSFDHRLPTRAPLTAIASAFVLDLHDLVARTEGPVKALDTVSPGALMQSGARYWASGPMSCEGISPHCRPCAVVARSRRDPSRSANP